MSTGKKFTHWSLSQVLSGRSKWRSPGKCADEDAHEPSPGGKMQDPAEAQPVTQGALCSGTTQWSCPGVGQRVRIGHWIWAILRKVCDFRQRSLFGEDNPAIGQMLRASAIMLLL